MDAIERLKGLLEKATAGPWDTDTRYGRDGEGVWTTAIVSDSAHLFDSLCDGAGRIDRDDECEYDGQARDNAKLIIAMRNALPVLLEIAEAAKALNNGILPYTSGAPLEKLRAAVRKLTPESGND